jgi:hypothetical protein
MNRNDVNADTPAIRKEGNLEILADFPAFEYVRTPAFMIMKHGSRFAIPMKTARHGILHKHFTLGSVIGYAVECGDDPIANLERAKERGHDLHWANANAVTLTAHKRDKERVFVLNYGDVITFEGIRFRLDKANNDNVKLTEVGRVDDISRIEKGAAVFEQASAALREAQKD